jgi:ABC-type dipeptide/oligopeptide/nickel transport system permease subunit
MTTLAPDMQGPLEPGMTPVLPPGAAATTVAKQRSEGIWAQALRSNRVRIGGGILLAILLACIVTLPWTLGAEVGPGGKGVQVYAKQYAGEARNPPALRAPLRAWFGYDMLGRSLLARCLLGGTISLAVGVAAATIAVVLGVAVGLIAGYRGGWVDSVLMRLVDILYGLPYILLIILFKIGFEQPLALMLGSAMTANLVVLFAAIGLVSWLTMARVVRGQVLSLRGQPFVEACRALGMKERRIFMKHILPNLVGPITVYATLTVPSAILQESFLSFLGVGVNAPLPTWGSLASDAVQQLSPVKIHWWLLLFPCALLAVTLLSLNFLGDGLRDVFDPKKEAAKI